VLTGPTVATIAAAFWRHAQAFYVTPEGAATGEAANYRPAIAALRRLYGPTAAADFGPRSLKALRRTMTQPQEVTDPKTGEKSIVQGWSRSYANRMTGRIQVHLPMGRVGGAGASRRGRRAGDRRGGAQGPRRRP
jgi:hypothetical protein